MGDIMNKEKFVKDIKEQLNCLNISIQDNQIEQFYNYMALLLEWNEKINLTAITEQSEVVQKHFVDSLTICKYINGNSKLIDVGTGAGFPGIPLKILNPNCDITLLDSLNKRLIYLKEVIEKLNLTKIQTVHYRAEDAGKNNQFREQFDIAVSRAVAPLNVLVEYLLPFVKVGGIGVCMKGSNLKEEIKMAQKAIKLLGGEIEKIEEFKLPNSDIQRAVVVIKKIEKTSMKYPRKAGLPSKEPI